MPDAPPGLPQEPGEPDSSWSTRDPFPLLVRSMTWESDGVLSLCLEDPSGRPLPSWEPGAHIDVKWENGVERQYSLCGDRENHHQWRIAILKEPHGTGGSAYAHEVLRPGDKVTARGPRNHFMLVPAPRYLFIAGGIGITPILPMLTEATRAGAQWSLLYGGRLRGSMAFLSELEDWGSRVAIHPQDEVGFLPLDDVLGTPTPDTLVYCCGPEPLLAAAESACAGWPADTFHCERFAPKPGADDGTATAFDVVLASSGQRFHIPADKGILEVLKEVRADVAYSCEEGTCGTCEATVVSGIPDHRDSVLSEQEKADGRTMMICVSRSLTDELVIDLL
jgi:ferredoxin-NADP reductase